MSSTSAFSSMGRRQSWLPMLLGLLFLTSNKAKATESTAVKTVDITVIAVEGADPTLEPSPNGTEDFFQDGTNDVPTNNNEEKDVNFDFSSWEPCGKTSIQYLQELTPQDNVQPCILYDIQPSNVNNSTDSNSFVVTLVQVTSAASNCHSGRDGAVVSVRRLNEENDGRGIAVGFQKNFYIQFRLVSLVAGHADYINRDFYLERHSRVLDAALTELQPQYIIGSCTSLAQAEDQVAWDHKTILLAQVGPPSYYQGGNPYLFGMHMNSDLYPIPASRALSFAVQDTHGLEGLKRQPIRVFYRTQSEFFYSTCRSAIDSLTSLGFTNIVEYLYDPDEDHDGDGIKNQFDVEFLEALADQACPSHPHPHGPDSDHDGRHKFGMEEEFESTPAIFACFLTEQDIVLPRLRQNGCRPTSLWLTAATWGWADGNPDEVPYFQGGGQWHPAFTYSDQFYDSGIDLLDQSMEEFGYRGSYDFVVSYSVPMLFAEHLKATYRVTDSPDAATNFGTMAGYEQLRRGLVVLNANTLFGPVSFDDNQRNNGRAAAGTQWLPDLDTEFAVNETSQWAPVFENRLVSPAIQAEAPIQVPAPSARDCPPGQYVNDFFAHNGTSLLVNRCSECPPNTITYELNQFLECVPCPEGSTTLGQTGETSCTYLDENLIPSLTLTFAYIMVSITWALALTAIIWLNRHRMDVVIQIAQYPFMMLICIGAIISSSTIVALSWQAGNDEDASAATTACRAAPFLYTIGWVLQYGSITAKTFRMHRIVNNQRFERIRVTALHTSWIVFLVLVLDMIVVISWTVAQPMEYRREITSVSLNDEEHLRTISSHGRCSAPEGSSIWTFAGVIVGIHFVLMCVTNLVLYKVSFIEERYQEQKYVALASVFVFEVLVIGFPVLFSVGGNTSATFLVLSSIIALNDVGILGFVFGPKVYFRKLGLKPGIAVGESLRKIDHKKAQQRETQRRNDGLESRASVASARLESSLGSLGLSREFGFDDLRSSAASVQSHAMDLDLDVVNGNEIENEKIALLQNKCKQLEEEIEILKKTNKVVSFTDLESSKPGESQGERQEQSPETSA